MMQASRNGNDLWLSYWVDTTKGNDKMHYSLNFYLVCALFNHVIDFNIVKWIYTSASLLSPFGLFFIKKKVGNYLIKWHVIGGQINLLLTSETVGLNFIQ